MKQVLIVGAGKGGKALLNMLQAADHMKVVGMVDVNPRAEGLAFAKSVDVSTGDNWRDWLDQAIDIVFEATGDQSVLIQLHEAFHEKATIIPGSVAYIIVDLLSEKERLIQAQQLQTNHQQLILDNIRDGMIVVNQDGNVQFVNKSTEQIMNIPRDDFIGKSVTDLITESRLPRVLHTGKKEVNQPLRLENGKRVITTRIPMISEDNELIGAFAVFKDITEVLALAEANTDLTEIKTMLEAIIQSSDEAISVVDEEGKGIMINPAYTRITGLKEEKVIGEPATVDIFEGESMHMKVLKTRRPVRSVRMRVGETKRDVLVNVAPVIVDGKIKGSVAVLHDVSEIKTLTNELKRARQIIRNLEAKYSFADIVGDSAEMEIALEQAKGGARTPATVLLRGESGTGKELFAHAIHNESERKHNKFIRVNCAAIAESILESELFGYEEGAFSGAKRGGKRGLFEEANYGSIFLDEIGELSQSMQAKLLRVLQEQEIVRVGGTDPIAIDVRIIAATNLNLEKAIMDKRFREDLYYRLNRLPIYIPALRERKSDIPVLVDHLIAKLNQDYGRKVQAISTEALDRLETYEWPGNVRELENIIGRAMIFMGVNEEVIRLKSIPKLVIEASKPNHEPFILGHDASDQSLQHVMSQCEKQYIEQVYKYHTFNKTKTAKALGVSIRNLYYKMEKYHIEKSSLQNLS